MTLPAASGETWILASLLVSAAVIDSRHRIIPNPLSALVALSAFAVAGPSWNERLLAALSLLVALLAINAVCRRIWDRNGFGMGDVKLLAALALHLGHEVWLVTYAAIVLGALAGLSTRSRTLPFAPWLLVGWVLVGQLGRV
ncbi:MAG: A24 family peptidase [Bacteroidota bacterium]